MLIGLMSLKNPTVFVQFHPVACESTNFIIVPSKSNTDLSTDMAKLNIEMSVRMLADRTTFGRPLLTRPDTDGRHDSQSRPNIRARCKAEIVFSRTVPGTIAITPSTYLPWRRRYEHRSKEHCYNRSFSAQQRTARRHPRNLPPERGASLRRGF
jgi:hypothetical protein